MPAPDGPVVVTGAAGFLGGRVARSLAGGARALARTPVPWLPASVQVRCDLLGAADDVAEAFAGASAVVHLAGHNEVIARQDPRRATEETAAMAAATRDAAVRAGVRRVVYVSTVHVYGEHLQPGAAITEELAPAPTSPYADARWACEQVLTSSDALDTVVLRLTNAVGAPADPRVDRWTLVANDLCRQAVLDRTMVLHSSGQQWRDFVPLDDACRIVIGSVDPGRVPGGTYNLASGTSSTIRGLAGVVQDRVRRRCGWVAELVAPEADGEPDDPYVVDVSALGDLGLRAQRSLEEAVDEIVEHCVQHEAALRSLG